MSSEPKISDQAAGRHEDPPDVLDPKADPTPSPNEIKDPEEWVIGHEPMTDAQAEYLKALSEAAKEPDAYDPELDKAEASKRIEQLKREMGL